MSGRRYPVWTPDEQVNHERRLTGFCIERLNSHELIQICLFAQSISSIENFKLLVERRLQPQPSQDILLHR
jgi:hypothetical protein